MKVGDLVEIVFHALPRDFVRETRDPTSFRGLVAEVLQEPDKNGFVKDPSNYACRVMAVGDTYLMPVFESEIVEVINESR